MNKFRKNRLWKCIQFCVNSSALNDPIRFIGVEFLSKFEPKFSLVKVQIYEFTNLPYIAAQYDD